MAKRSRTSRRSSPPISLPPKRIITLRSSEGTEFKVDERVAVQSEIINTLLKDDHNNRHNIFPLPNVKAATLTKVIKFCDKHIFAQWAPRNQELQQWDHKFIKKFDNPDLVDILNAAHYMEIKSLVDLCTQRVADLIKDMSVEDVRKFFGITNDFTPEEEEAVRNEYWWAFY